MNIIKYYITALATVFSMVAAAQSGIVEREGWLDFNYAERQALGDGQATFDLSSLLPGVHWFTMHLKNSDGVWGPAVTKAFLITREQPPTATMIQRVEAWFDHDVAHKQVLNGDNVNIDISSLIPGMHWFTIRVQDDLGVWSPPVNKLFIIPHATPEDVELVSYCYWFDDDVAHAVAGELPVTGKTVSSVISIDMSTVPSGQHTIYWMIGDSKGAWGRYAGEVNSMSFYNKRGDVNMDGDVNIADVTALIDHLLSGDNSNIDGEAADCDFDGTVNIADVTSLIDYLLSGSW